MDADKPVNTQKQAARPVLVWDVPTRLFHWLVVVLVAAAYATSELNWMGWHVRIGEMLLTLVLFRLLWGFFGSDTARFRNFMSAPAAAWQHLRHVLRREADLQVGHNSAGGWMVLLLLALLLGETLSGLYVNNDVADDGPLTQWVPASIANAITALHTILWDALLAAVALHVLAIAVYAVAKGHNLLRPMLTGRKRLPERIRAPRQASTIRALLLLVLSATLVTLLATYL
ncbi:cytochrome b/b6 domain-containing protein [Caballeronia sordidicola]|jgi:cytochrome b|uniref:Ni,Fe-hydrogenase I cytochrome b subunit n=1 Tax=Caballeronia sordidicola TaxID=196367 RepID=A0A226WUY4_CABSO|nr:cytochrome b/b6 domain-containing protein [Caballeronia sordidicola]OXC74994.1 Ni,Fe-hydrogenase I cytochrome b subunit [Caballeronia sordidicola]